MSTTESEVYVPGTYICPQCGFIEAKLTMSAVSGAVGVSDKASDPCPNDGAFMRPLSWKAYAEDAAKNWRETLDRLETARKTLDDEADYIEQAARLIVLETVVQHDIFSACQRLRATARVCEEINGSQA